MMSPYEEISLADPKTSAIPPPTEGVMTNGNSAHPLQQIAESGNHRLLLKQWLKEEDSIDRRVALKESRLDRTRKEVTQLCCFYFLFHGIVLTLLFNAASRNPKGGSCRRAWIPSLLSLVASLVIIWAVRYKMDVETHIERLLRREKDDAKLMAKCIQELKRKGTSFDLLKEVDTLRRAKSLRVEPRAVMKWSGRDMVTFFFIAMSCLVLVFTKVVLCN